MARKPKHPNHYIREWRLHRRLSLRRLAARMEESPGEELISHASIGRIENGHQPYSEPILEALAKALNVSKSALLEMHPEKEGEVIDLLRRLPKERHAEAIDFLKYLSTK